MCSSTQGHRMVGFIDAQPTTNTGYSNLDFGFYCDYTSAAYVTENWGNQGTIVCLWDWLRIRGIGDPPLPERTNPVLERQCALHVSDEQQDVDRPAALGVWRLPLLHFLHRGQHRVCRRLRHAVSHCARSGALVMACVWEVFYGCAVQCMRACFMESAARRGDACR